MAESGSAQDVRKRIGRYEVVGKLAAGGMAQLFVGRLVGPSGFERPVVIKCILPHLAAAPGFVEMFLDEARLVARIRHPNVIQVHELDRDGDELFMAMEYLEGETVSGILRRLWVRKTSMDPAAAALVAASACSGLHAAHELADDRGRPLGLVHRDVSPQNVFVTYSGEVKVLDFGIAKVEGQKGHTEAGLVKGKTGYMSPEQCLGRRLDRRSDVFSIGVVLFEMCTLRRLFDRENSLLAFRAICDETIPSMRSVVDTLPESLERVAVRALHRDVDRRYATALDMRRDLLAAARELVSSEPEEHLAAMMRELFPERIAEKRELVRSMEQGTAVSSIPEAETDSAVSLPSAEPHRSPVPEAARPKSRRLLATTLALSAAMLLGVGYAFQGRGTPRTAAAPAPPTSAPRAADSGVARKVAIEIHTKPAGARVTVAGEDRGPTPARIELPLSSAVLPVELTLDGFEPQRFETKADVDRHFALTLERLPTSKPSAGAAPRVRKATPMAPSSSPKPTADDDFTRFH